MNYAISPYGLIYKKSKEKRFGFLLRGEVRGQVGYADCHPWPELGEEPLELQKKALVDGKPTPLLNQALAFLALDLDARSRKKSLFEGLTIPRSHLLTDLEAIPSAIADYIGYGVQHLKVKVSKDDADRLLDLNEHLFKHGMKWRLDFNGKQTPEEAENFLQKVASILSSIDLIEDICPYNKLIWEALESKYGVTLACDFEKPSLKHRHPIIYKPCSRAPDEATFAKKVIVTSSLGHPISQLMAAYAAATMPSAKDETGGFLSHFVYEENDFSKSLQVKKGRLIPPDGTGFGFDHLLEALPWQSI